MERVKRIPYVGDALKLFISTLEGTSNYEKYVVYRSKSYKSSLVYFYVDSKNYLHIFSIIASTSKKDMYQVSDYKLSAKNTMVYSDKLNIEHKSKEYLEGILYKLVGKNIKEVNRV